MVKIQINTQAKAALDNRREALGVKTHSQVIAYYENSLPQSPTSSDPRIQELSQMPCETISRNPYMEWPDKA